MIPHPSAHLTFTLLFFVAVVALMFAIRNPVARRRLLFTALVLAASAGLHASLVWFPAVAWLQEYGWKIEALALTLAVAQALVTLTFNRWSPGGRGADRAPAIVQDALIALLVVIASLFTFASAEFLTTSAIVAAVIGFALQETLGNAFAGLAIQIDRPFRVGHWITVGGFEGTVREITWRATKIWTKAGNMVILPNSLVAREAINNYSEPLAPTRIYVEVGVGYQVPPNEARDALFAALRQVPVVLTDPPPEPLFWDFAASALLFRVHFWVADFSAEEHARDDVRRAIYYELGRRNIEIPWPIQIEYQRNDPPPEDPALREQRRLRSIDGVHVLADLPLEARTALAAAAMERVFGDGEIIVREGDTGGSMFVVMRGRVAITVGPERREVAITDTGGYFGEMSLLTGEPRSATVVARGDCRVLELSADLFKAYVTSHPDVIEDLATAAAERRRGLDRARGVAAVSQEIKISLASRMRRFFGLE